MDQEIPTTTTSTPDAVALSDRIARGETETPYDTGRSMSFGEQARLTREAGEGAPQPSASEARRKEITQKLIDEPHSPDAEKLRVELRQILARNESPAEIEAREQAPIQELRERFGIQHDWPSQTHEANFNTDAEAEFYNYAVGQGWEASVVRNIVQDYINATDGLGTLLSDEALDRMESRYVKNGFITQEQARTLRRWLRTEVEGEAGNAGSRRRSS